MLAFLVKYAIVRFENRNYPKFMVRILKRKDNQVQMAYDQLFEIKNTD